MKFHYYYFFLLILLSSCSGLLFYPQKNWHATPDQSGYSFQNISISTNDGIQLSAWLMPQRLINRKGVVIFFHGNSRNISTHVQRVYWLVDEGYDVLLVDYRGFGHSEGSTDLQLSIADIETSIRWFVNLYPKDTAKYLLGHSLGASMAGYVIAQHEELAKEFSVIVLEAGFSDYRQVMREAMSKSWLLYLFQYPASLGMPDTYNLIDVVDKIAPTPLMIIHGKADQVVHFEHGLELFSKAKEPKYLLSFDGNHNDAFDDIERRETVLHYFEEHASRLK